MEIKEKVGMLSDRDAVKAMMHRSEEFHEEGKTLEACIMIIAGILVETNIRLDAISENLTELVKAQVLQ